jgi:hypothetical protein
MHSRLKRLKSSQSFDTTQYVLSGATKPLRRRLRRFHSDKPRECKHRASSVLGMCNFFIYHFLRLKTKISFLPVSRFGFTDSNQGKTADSLLFSYVILAKPWKLDFSCFAFATIWRMKNHPILTIELCSGGSWNLIYLLSPYQYSTTSTSLVPGSAVSFWRLSLRPVPS